MFCSLETAIVPGGVFLKICPPPGDLKHVTLSVSFQSSHTIWCVWGHNGAKAKTFFEFVKSL